MYALEIVMDPQKKNDSKKEEEEEEEKVFRIVAGDVRLAIYKHECVFTKRIDCRNHLCIYKSIVSQLNNSPWVYLLP